MITSVVFTTVFAKADDDIDVVVLLFVRTGEVSKDAAQQGQPLFVAENPDVN